MYSLNTHTANLVFGIKFKKICRIPTNSGKVLTYDPAFISVLFEWDWKSEIENKKDKETVFSQTPLEFLLL